MNEQLKVSKNPVDISGQIAHCFITSDPAPWTSLCGQKVADKIKDSTGKQRCVVCSELAPK